MRMVPDGLGRARSWPLLCPVLVLGPGEGRGHVLGLATSCSHILTATWLQLGVPSLCLCGPWRVSKGGGWPLILVPRLAVRARRPKRPRVFEEVAPRSEVIGAPRSPGRRLLSGPDKLG